MIHEVLTKKRSVKRTGSHIHDFDIGASVSELRPAPDHREAERDVSGCATLRLQPFPVVSVHPDNL